MSCKSRIFPLALQIPNKSPLPLPTYSSIAYRPLCVQSVDVSKHQRTTFTFFCSLLSTHYHVSASDSNNQSVLNSVSYFVYVFLALVIDHAVCMRHIVICGLLRSMIYLHIIS